MTYTPLTKEQYNKAISAGFTPQQIIQNEKVRKLQEGSSEEKTTFIQKAAKFFGVDNISKAIAYAVSPEVRQYEKESIGAKPTLGQLAGDVLQVGATVGTMGIGGAATKGALGVAKLAGKVGVAGGVAGFGAGLSEGKSTTESIKQALTTGLASAATYGTLAGAGKIAKTVLEKIPVRLVQMSTKLEQESAQVVLDNKKWGSLGKILGWAKNEGDRLNGEIVSKISVNNGEIVSKTFLQKVVSRIQNKWQGVSNDKIMKALKGADIDPFLRNKTVDYLTADNIRKGLYGTTSFKDTTKFSQSVKDILWQEIVNTYREPTGTVELFKQYAPIVETIKKLPNIIKNQQKKGIVGLTDIMTGLGFGFGTMNPLTGVASVATKKAITSPTVQTATAVGLNELNKLIDKIPSQYFDKAGRISRTALVKALSEIQ